MDRHTHAMSPIDLDRLALLPQASYRDPNMARPEISEFSYGYALTEQLAWNHRDKLRASPFFPSLVDEGKPGWGFDMHLNVNGLLVFLQFKLGHPVLRRNAVECKQLAWQLPIYRMHLRAPRYSTQHQSLVELESKGNLVYYVAPVFHERRKLDDAYRTRQVAQRSYWLRPSAVVLPDDREHDVSYCGPAGPHCVCSKHAVPFETNASFDAFVSRIQTGLEHQAAVSLNERLVRLANDLETEIVTREERERAYRARIRRPRSGEGPSQATRETVAGRTGAERTRDDALKASLARLREEVAPPARAAYLTRTFFDAELVAFIKNPI
jgi:hypothetical protein